jgi:exopolysaccharide production protein ExoZ
VLETQVQDFLPTGKPENAAIEGLRGLAAMIVLAAHYAHFFVAGEGWWSFATTGVDLFFVLSGFVFAPYLFGRPLALLPHLVRRFFRLYPLYIAAVLLYVGLHEPRATAWSEFLPHLLMAHTLGSLETAFFYNPAFWSLPPEVEFYLLLPLLALWALRWGFVSLIAAAIVLHLGIAVFEISGKPSVSPRDLAAVHLPGVLVEFMLGAAAYVLATKLARPAARRAVALCGLALLAVIGTLFTLHYTGGPILANSAPAWLRGNIGFGAALGYMCLLAAASGTLQTGSRWRIRLAVYAGHLSYGVYLFHNAAQTLAGRLLPQHPAWQQALSALLMTLLIALLAHLVIEKPLRTYGRSLAARL